VYDRIAAERPGMEELFIAFYHLLAAFERIQVCESGKPLYIIMHQKPDVGLAEFRRLQWSI
jgi:hypothetical protein